MNFLKKIVSFLTSPPGGGRDYWYYVRCDKCGEIIKARIDKHTDLSVKYGDKQSDDTYFCRRVVVGSKRCYQPIEVTFTFDNRRSLIDRDIKGGEFVTEEEYLAQQEAEEISA